ncbi:hypothetical protein H2200_005313 [Cladophialophora chaetospira]|uniref:C2H2-type domain-containing protein n=1 Tax=Cladophialophora chaetospira TaxID=386627 RepID=A0AA38XBY2_9EURO|nr:hypothetical protein H2200_005313 [Cladophialophora chaetospira]
MLRLKDAQKLLQNDYLSVEAGHGLTSDGMYHIAASTYMPECTAEMIDWWFGFIHTTEQYRLWHPRDHVFSDWEGPRNNQSQYIGGHHLVHEYIGGELCKLKISFKDPSEYFGRNFKEEFEAGGYGTAICGRVGLWDDEHGSVLYTGHLIHLIKNEPNACRMRSRFWLGDIEGVSEAQGDKVPDSMRAGLLKHATEEMAILALQLPELYRKHRQQPDTGSRPYVCETCSQSFTRPDSLARHKRRHNEIPPDAVAYEHQVDKSRLVPESDPVARPPSEAISTLQTGMNAPESTSHDMLEEMSLDQEPFISLNWPDSEDLLNSILSAEFANLPSLEVLPSQSMVRGAQESEQQPVSPWLTSDASQSQMHGGNHAVRNLSQIINSLNVTLRKTAQVFHSLGFFWARETGMFDLELEEDNELFTFDHVPAPTAADEKWKAWAAQETQLRALLGHYILDAQLSDQGGPTSQRHTSSSLPVPCDARIFDAADASTWQEHIVRTERKSQRFSDLFFSLFSDRVHVRHLGTSLSGLTASVLLEGLKALSSERAVAAPAKNLVAVPLERDISRALGRMYRFIAQSASLSLIDKDIALLRWHTICMHTTVNLNGLCRALFHKHNIDQCIIGGRKIPTLDLPTWVTSARARLGILHAFSIYHILQKLPTGQTQRIHVPIAVFSAAMVYIAFLLGGVHSISLPIVECWDSVVLINLDEPVDSVTDDLDFDVRRYLDGTLKEPDKCINIMYDISLFSRTLKNLEELWGVSREMQLILEELSLKTA